MICTKKYNLRQVDLRDLYSYVAENEIKNSHFLCLRLGVVWSRKTVRKTA